MRTAKAPRYGRIGVSLDAALCGVRGLVLRIGHVELTLQSLELSPGRVHGQSSVDAEAAVPVENQR